jgi:secretory lipase
MFSPPSVSAGRGRELRILFATIAVYLSPVTPLGTARVVAQSQTAASTRQPGTSRRLPLTKFYDSPKPLPAGKAGELIRSEPVDEYYLSADFSAFRILYHSRSASGQDVAASGVVLVPEGKPPTGGWPVIAWAHGFSGSARQCAPSLLRNMYSGPFLSMYIDLGYAVVVADYVGLGTDSRSAVLDVPSDAADVIYAISAAHAAVPRLGAKWIAMGPALGGNVAIGVAEMEGDIRDPNFLGSIAISGVADFKDAYEHAAKDNFVKMIEFLAYSVKTVYPDFNLRDMLTEKALPAYEQVDGSCGSVDHGATFASEMVRENWKKNEFVEKFLGRNMLGQKLVHGPLLVISGAEDPLELPAMSEQTIARMCKQGDRVQIDKLSEPQAGMVMGDSVRDQMAWIEARFAGRAAANNCP